MNAAGLHAALRALPSAAARTFAQRGLQMGLALAFAAGLALPWLCNAFFPASAIVEGTSPGTKAASFLLNLGLLAVALCRLPLAKRSGWPFCCAWLEMLALTACAFLGLKWMGDIPFGAALAMAALTLAQATALYGAAALLFLWCGRFAPAARMVLALGMVLAVGGIFWTKPLLQGLYGGSAGSEAERERAMRLADAGARAVLAFGPQGGMAEAWNRTPSGFDLIRGHQTYVLWIGSDRLLKYPRLWPGRDESSAGNKPSPLAPGLIVGLGLWGSILLWGCDLLAAAWPTSRSQSRSKNENDSSR